MIINHNIAALNTHRQMGNAQSAQMNSMEKLSSGLRINSAKDDAAGLSISEKMRGQIRGLEQSSKNAQDGISLIQTAEGTLSVTQDILQRMRELAVQSSNDTNTTADRATIQSEVDELAKEITRISNTTEFNTKNLLAGGSNNKFQVGANSGQNLSVSIGAFDAKSLGVAGDIITTSLTAANGVTTLTEASGDLGAGAKVTVSSVNDATASATQGTITGTIAAVDATTYTGSKNVAYQIEVAGIGTPGTGDVTSIRVSSDGGNTWNNVNESGGEFNLGQGLSITIADDVANVVGNKGALEVTAKNVELQLANDNGDIGSSVVVYSDQSGVVLGDPSSDRTAKVGFNFGTLSAGDANIAQTKTESTSAITDANGNVSTQAIVQKGISVSTQSSADAAITTINNAIESVSSQRSKLGAVQNRLDHTINNLNTSSENITAAESRIRDVDYAEAA